MEREDQERGQPCPRESGGEELRPRPPALRRLIVNADDFGRSSSINKAIIRAYREGILTSASLMVNEPSCAEAVALAKQNPNLGIGLHLTMQIGRASCRDRV